MKVHSLKKMGFRSFVAAVAAVVNTMSDQIASVVCCKRSEFWMMHVIGIVMRVEWMRMRILYVTLFDNETCHYQCWK